ncbi:MAG: hypothetical protein ACD_79C00063G0005 [uncultured bacterium]|nr:MAG: hypothetical protein ACD_79C00063G0005 [uncultured bacterium]
MKFEVKYLLAYRELIWNLVVRNLKIRYKNSSLGFFWTLLNPIFFIMIYYIFIRIMRFQMDLPGLLAGVIPWHFLTMTLGDSVDTISGNSSLITKVRFPRIILPLSTAIANLINYVLSIFVFVLLLPMLGGEISLKIFLLVPWILILFVFVMGLSLFLATCNVYFKDTPHILSVFLMAWFFLTPIIYPLSLIPEKFQAMAFLNPMTGIISLYRYSIAGHELVLNAWFFAGIFISLFFLIIGLFVFNKYEPYFADEL